MGLASHIVLPILLLVGALAAPALLAAPLPQADSPQKRLCVPLPSNSDKIERLIERIDGAKRAAAERDWREFAEFYQPFDRPFGWKSKAARHWRKNWKHTELIEWHLLRVLQCGDAAGAFVQTQVLDAIGFPEEGIVIDTHIEFWVWHEGEWYGGGLPDHLRKRTDWDKEKLNVWLEKPCEMWDEVWAASGLEVERDGSGECEIAAAPTDEESGILGRPEPEDTGRGRGTVERETPEANIEQLRTTVCLYAQAVLEGRKEDALEFWDIREREEEGFQDDAVEAIEASGGEAEFGSYGIDRIQLLYGLSARVDLTFVLYRDERARRGDKVRVTSFWYPIRGRWLRNSQVGRGWQADRAKDLWTGSCPRARIRRIVVEQETP